MNRDRLRTILLRHEGLRLKPYRDSVGKLTIGVGRSLEGEGISESEAYTLLDHDIDTATAGLTHTLPWFTGLDDVRKEVLVDMCFNLGIIKLFAANPEMLKAAQDGNFNQASIEMLNGPWKEEVHARAFELADAMRTGAWGVA